MAHAIYLCSQADQQLAITPTCINKISQHLQPDDIHYPSPYTSIEEGLLGAIVNPAKSLPVEGVNLCLGGFFGNKAGWEVLGTTPPDGTYALFRGDANTIELLTDVFGTRTIWYFFDEIRFIASTSQRAISCILGDVCLNRDSLNWVLSAGQIGPVGGWDSRLHRVPENGKLMLDRKQWKISVSNTPITFKKSDASTATLKKKMADAIDQTLDSLQVDLAHWVLPLSGGYDSRGLLQGLSKKGQVRTVTWGTEASLQNPNSDACIAQQLSEKYSTNHRYCPLQPEQLDPYTVLGRFIKNSEGRTDHLSGYMDGFKLWASFFEDGIHGVIRGDDPYSELPRKNTWLIHSYWSYLLLTDYNNTDKLIKVLDLPEQQRISSLEKKPKESLSDYAERFYIRWRYANTLAALNLTKAAYCEIINPYLSKKVSSVTREQPDDLFQSKQLTKEIISERTPDIPIAHNVSIAGKVEAIRTPNIANHILDYLRAYQGSSLNSETLQLIIKRAEKARDIPSSTSVTTILRNVFSRTTKVLGIKIRPSLDPMLLAFRAYIICRMDEILAEDAALLKK